MNEAPLYSRCPNSISESLNSKPETRTINTTTSEYNLLVLRCIKARNLLWLNSKGLQPGIAGRPETRTINTTTTERTWCCWAACAAAISFGFLETQSGVSSIPAYARN